MALKDSIPQLIFVDLSAIDPDPRHVRQNINPEALKGLTNAVKRLGIIQPILVRAAAEGRYQVIAGERRRLAAIEAGESRLPVIVRECSDAEAHEIRVFENIGLGVRSALEPRDMANAIQAIAERFDSPEEAALYFGRAPTWLSQATAAANLSERVTSLLDAGKISSTSAAVQLEKLSKKDEAKADSLIEQIAQLPEGEKISKKSVDAALQGKAEAQKPSEEPSPDAPSATIQAPAPAPAPAPAAIGASPDVLSAPAAASRPRINPGKVKLVAELLGLDEQDEEEFMVRLIDEFLAMKGA